LIEENENNNKMNNINTTINNSPGIFVAVTFIKIKLKG